VDAAPTGALPLTPARSKVALPLRSRRRLDGRLSATKVRCVQGAGAAIFAWHYARYADGAKCYLEHVLVILELLSIYFIAFVDFEVRPPDEKRSHSSC
jgi:hypothetical protein